MQQFFIENLEAPSLSNEQQKQCSKVLRMRKGDQIRLVDMKRQGGIFEFVDDELSNLKLIEPIVFEENKVSITLIASLIRNERMEWMIQKACELGVDRIVLYSAVHGVVKDFGARTDRKLERLNTIAFEASEQSFRSHPIKVEGVINLNDISNYQSDTNLYADVKPLPHILEVMGDTENISIIIGPEGGFADKEREVFESLNFKPVSLGKHVLRAESASMVACTLIHAQEVKI